MMSTDPIPNRSRVRLTTLAVALVGAAVAGCASSGKDFDSTKVTSIQKGKTTESDLVQMFGEPQQRMTDADGSQHLTWRFSEAKANGASFIPVYGMFAGGSSGTDKSLMVTVANGVVTDFQSTQGTTGVNRGG